MTIIQVQHILLFLVALVASVALATSAEPPNGSRHPADYELRHRPSFENAKAGLFGGAEGDAAVTSDRYDVQNYLLDLTIDVGAETVQGLVGMIFASRHDGLTEVVMDLTTDLNVDSVLFRGATVPYTHGGDSLVIHLETTLARDTIDSLKVYYGGTPPRQQNEAGLSFQVHHSSILDPPEDEGPVVANLSEPAYAKYWWPCKDRPDDKALSLVKLTVPDTLLAVSNGIQRNVFDPAPGWRTFVWEETHPIASYLISVAVSDYIEMSEDCITQLSGTVPLRNWIFPPDSLRAVVDLEPVCDMMLFMEEIAGAYPFQGEKYGHAEFMWGGAMEHQTVTSYGIGLFTGDGLNDNILLHELAHQWFGDSLGPRKWADIWLNEGFATYCEALWVEHTLGRAAYLANMDRRRHFNDWQGHSPVYDPVPVFPGRVIYDKGAWILHMLRGRLGEGVFQQFFYDYATGGDRPLGTVITSEFIDLASQYATEDLTDFFHPWLTTDAVPQLQFDYDVGAGPQGPDSHLVIYLTQTQNTLFDNVYPVRVTTTTGDTLLSLPLATWSESFTFDLLAGVTAVELDPEHWVLWQESGFVPLLSGLTTIYPNPAGMGPINFAYRIPDNMEIKLMVYDLRGRLVTELTSDENPLIWDGHDSSGRGVASGIYWAALHYGGERSVKKFTIVR